MKNQEVRTLSENQAEAGETHSHRMKMMLGMAVCCGAPILAVTAISAFGWTTSSLNSLVALACPIGMGVMMFFMMRGNRDGAKGKQTGHPCCLPLSAEKEPADQVRESVQAAKTSTLVQP